MTDGFDWGRKGPPRPGSASMDHPRGLERPWLTPKERRAQAVLKAEEAKSQRDRLKLFQEAVRLEPHGLELERRVQQGEKLGFFEITTLERWRKIRPCFDGE